MRVNEQVPRSVAEGLVPGSTMLSLVYDLDDINDFSFGNGGGEVAGWQEGSASVSPAMTLVPI